MAKRIKFQLLLMVLIGITIPILVTVYVNSGRDYTDIHESGEVTIIKFLPEWNPDERIRFAYPILAGTLSCLLFVGGYLFGRQLIVGGTCILVITILIYVPSWMLIHRHFTTIYWNQSWQIMDSVQVEDGTVYFHLGYAFLQNQRIVLATMLEQDGRKRKFKIIGETNGDSSRSYASVVRSAGISGHERFKLLYIKSQKLLLGMMGENDCYYSYNLVSQSFTSGEEIKAISPFILLKNEDTPYWPDVRRLALKINENPPFELAPGILTYASGVPTIESLQEGLVHPNAMVRTIAQSLLAMERQLVLESKSGNLK